MSMIVDIADALVTLLNGETFSQTFTAVRKHLPQYKLAQMDTLHVTVVPKTEVISAGGGTRASQQFDYEIDIAIQQRFGDDASEESAEFVELMDLREELIDFLRGRDIGTTGTSPIGRWTAITNEPIYAPEHMAQMRQFTSLLTVSYRMWRDEV